MIRNEVEYQEAVKRLKEERARYDAHEQELARVGLKADEGTRCVRSTCNSRKRLKHTSA